VHAACRFSGGTYNKNLSLQKNYVPVPNNGTVNSILERREWSIKWRGCKFFKLYIFCYS